MSKILNNLDDLLRLVLSFPFLLLGDLCFYVADFLLGGRDP